MRYDLHCHSTYSDGLLPPAAVVARAAQRGVDVLALTDHDVVDGLPEALVAARDAGIVLVCGSELSVTWRDNTIHVIALRIDPDNAILLEGLAAIWPPSTAIAASRMMRRPESTVRTKAPCDT
jgi:predicted metal-dependent phosphoesterase TrpH